MFCAAASSSMADAQAPPRSLPPLPGPLCAQARSPPVRASNAFAAIAVLSLFVGACGERKAPEGISILWVQPLRDHPVHKLMQAGFLQRCKEKGYTCEVVGNPSATSFDVPATIPLADAALA